MSSAPRHYTNGRVAKSAAEEACHQGETPRGSRHPRKPQGSRAESGSRWVVEVVEVEVVEVLFRSTSVSMQPRNTQPRHLDNVDAPPSPGSSGRCSCRITGAEQGRLVRVSILGLSNGGARPPEAAHPPPTPPLGPVVLRQSRQESGGELGQLKKARRGGAKAGALHPARGRLRLAPPLTALWLLRRRSMSFASGVGCSLASSPVGHRPSASPHADHSRARRRRRASPRRHACLLTREPIEGVRAGGALRRRRSSDRARSGRCSAPPLRAPAAASAATPDAPPFPSPVRLPRVMWQCARAARPGVCMAPIPIPVRTG